MIDRLKKTFNTPVGELSSGMKFLIFCLCLAFLAFIAWPASLSHPPMARYSRLKSNMRTLATGIESYAADYGAYPPSTFDEDLRLNWQYAEDGPTFDRRILLSTPVAYIAAYPYDNIYNEDRTFDFLLGKKEIRSNFAYWNKDQYYLIYAPGIDGKFDIDTRLFEKRFIRQVQIDGISTTTLLTTAALRYLDAHSYDPTNGTESGGDLWFSSGILK